MKIYNKLVRDRIPEIIEASGKKANYRVLRKNEYKQALKDKLLEEVNEFLKAETHKEMQEEAADIAEVLMAIWHEFNLYGMEVTRLNKTEEKGGFDKRYFLKSVEY